jgi:hypothetical protein
VITFDDGTTELEHKARHLQLIALVETASYALLFVFWAVLDSLAGTKVMGFVHGWVVIGFAVMVIWITPAMRWRWWFPVLVLVTGPLGGIIVYEKIKRHGAPDRTAPASLLS